MTGVACCLAHVGSFAMSMGFILGGVPVKLITPSTLPVAAETAVNLPAFVLAAEDTRSAIARMGKVLFCIWATYLSEKG
jgi:hypothetical protein